MRAMRALYVSHPQVGIDPEVPVPLWPLSADGRARARAFAVSGVIPPAAMIFSSRERKAMELAEILAEYAGTLVMADHLMGENDRSSTGFLPPALFEVTADRFFSHPEESIDGWERAVDAQARIVDTVTTAIACLSPQTPAVFCGHGGVGTLLKCHIARRPISRAEDQSRHGHRGGGNCFTFDLDPPRLGCDWTPMETMRPGWFG
jgi:broad specificity phosphatase PhoE